MCVIGTQTKPTSTFKIYLESVYNWSSKHKICKHYQMLKMNILQAKVWATNTLCAISKCL